MMHLWKNPRDGMYYLRKGQRRKSLRTKDKAEAEAAYRLAKRKYLAGTLAILDKKPRVVTLAEFRDRYMKTREDRSPDTKRADALAFRKAIDHFGDGRELGALFPEDVSNFMAALRKHVSQGAANAYFRHLRAAFNVAMEWDLIKKNPFAKIKLPRVEKEIPRLVSAEVRERILASIKDSDYRRMIEVYLITGLRRRELVNLRWKDVLPEGIRIRGKRGKYRILPPAPAILERLGPGGEPDEYVFPRWRDPNVITRMFRRAADAAGYPDTKLHHCRHTAASSLAMMGYGPETVRELLGHTTTAMTLHYQHVTRAHLLEAMRRLGQPTTIEIEPEAPAGVPALTACNHGYDRGECLYCD